MVYGAALERRFTRKGIEGSNPSPSAKLYSFIMKERLTAVISGSFDKFKAEIDAAHDAFADHNVLVIAPDKGWLYIPRLVQAGYKGNRPLPTERGLGMAAIERQFLDNIDKADFVYVCNPHGYIGITAAAEIGYALGGGKPVYLKEPINFALTDFRPDQIEWLQASTIVMGDPKHPSECTPQFGAEQP